MVRSSLEELYYDIVDEIQVAKLYRHQRYVEGKVLRMVVELSVLN